MNKEDLHVLLRALGVLKEDEQLLLVNNIDLRDYRRPQVSVLVDTVRNSNIYKVPFSELTARELEITLKHLYAFEQFLLREFMQVHEQISCAQSELKRRSGDTGINCDGIPVDIEKNMHQALKDILAGKTNHDDDTTDCNS